MESSAQFVPALDNPSEAGRPRLRKEVLSFRQALAILKQAKDGFVRCAARHVLGQCREQIPVTEGHTRTLLDQLSIADPGSVVKVMHLFLCPKHWNKTEFYCALFLSWFKFAGEKPQEYDKIVANLESAKVMLEEDFPPPNRPFDLDTATLDNLKNGSVLSGPGSTHFHSDYSNAPTSAGRIETAMSNLSLGAELSHETDSNFKTKESSIQDINFKGAAPLVTWDTFACLELGVAQLEITYQKSLKCIAMALDGWRCSELVPVEQLHQAQTLVRDLGDTKEEFEMLARLVLCPAHACTQLPETYSRRWSEFAAKRLPREEALKSFNSNEWANTIFFDDQTTPKEGIRKSRSASNLFQSPFERSDRLSPGYAETKSKAFSPVPRLNAEGKHFDFNFAAPPRSSTALDNEVQSETSANTILPLSAIPDMRKSEPLPSSPPIFNESEKSENSATVIDVGHEPKVSNADKSSLAFSDMLNVPDFSNGPLPTQNIASPTLSPSVKVPGDSSKLFLEVEKLSVLVQGLTDDLRNSKYSQIDQTAEPTRDLEPPTIKSKAQRRPVSVISQGSIDGAIKEEMGALIPRGGYVYIFKSAELKLVKIGKANNVERRRSQISNGCQIPDLEEVESGTYHLRYPEKVERLVHLELQNFRVRLMCQHQRGSSSGSGEETLQEHREWFNVSERVAIQSVQRWRHFVEAAYTEAGTLRDLWAQRLALLANPESLESTYLRRGLDENNGSDVAQRQRDLESHHWLRHKRYQNWLEGKTAEAKQVQSP